MRPSSTPARRRRRRSLQGGELLWPAAFTRDAETIEVYWRIREGLHGLLGGCARRARR